MSARIHTPPRFCETCSKLIPRRKTEGAQRYSGRKFCGRVCEGMSGDHRRIMSQRPKRRYRNTSPLVARVARDLYFVGKLKQREIGRIFDIGQPSVSRMISGQVWADV